MTPQDTAALVGAGTGIGLGALILALFWDNQRMLRRERERKTDHHTHSPRAGRKEGR